MKRRRTHSVQCPNCGTPVQVMQQTSRGALLSYAPAPKAPPDPHMVRAVLAPFRQSAISGGWVAAISGTITALTEHAQAWPKIALLGGALCGGIVWAMAIWDDNRLRWRIETALGIDIDRDGHTGEPPPPIKAPDQVLDGPAPSVLVPERKPGEKYPHWNSYDVPWTNYREARNVARAVLRWGQPFTRRDLKKAGVIPKDDTSYTPIYNAMLENGFLKKGNSQPTEKGKLYLEGLLLPHPGEKWGKKEVGCTGQTNQPATNQEK